MCDHFVKVCIKGLKRVTTISIFLFSLEEDKNTSWTKCNTCQKSEGTRRCSRCKADYYCSKECQRKDWKKHQPICDDLVEYAERTTKMWDEDKEETSFDSIRFNARSEIRAHSRFVKEHLWPSEQVIHKYFKHFYKTLEDYYKHEQVSPPTDYNHELAKALWQVGHIQDFTRRNTEYRRLGWKICASVAHKSQDEQLACMRMYFYLIHFGLVTDHLFADNTRPAEPLTHLNTDILWTWCGVGGWFP